MDSFNATTAQDFTSAIARERPVKLGSILETLIGRGGSSSTRRKVAEAVGVSPAALSQYIHDQARPSFKTLLAMADFFGVSLDFLVYGAAQTSNMDYGPLARYVDHALASVQARASRHSAIVAKLGGLLAAELSAVGERLLAEGMNSASFLDDSELLILERYSNATDLVSMDLQYDLIVISDSEEAAGRFLPVVAANLSQGRTYRFLLPRQPDAEEAWLPHVERLRRTLGKMIGRDVVWRNCQFRQSRIPVTNGIGIYKLDVQAVAAEAPALHMRVVDYLDGDGRLGYVIAPNSEDHGDVVMNSSHVLRATQAFEALWSAAEAL